MEAATTGSDPKLKITTIRDRVVAGLARGIAEDLIRCEAMTGAINQADEDCVLSGHSCDPRTNTVSLYDDENSVIAARLPQWITIE